MRNPRMTVTFTEPQMDYLKKEAERLGISAAEAVRWTIDAYKMRETVDAYRKEKHEHSV